MMGRRSGALAMLAAGTAGLLVASGCAPDSSATTDDPGAWVASACSSIDQVRQTAERPHEVTVEELTGPDRAAPVIELLEDVSTATHTAREEVAALGVPPVEDGQSAQDEILGAFDEREEKLAESRDFVVRAQDRWDPLAPSQVIGAGQSAYRSAPALGRAIERIPELRDAYRAAPECQDL